MYGEHEKRKASSNAPAYENENKKKVKVVDSTTTRTTIRGLTYSKKNAQRMSKSKSKN